MLLTCIEISQEAGQVVWYSHLFQNFPQFVVIHIVKGFDIINKPEIDVFFWNPLAFSMIQQILAIWSLVPLLFLKPALTSRSSRFTYCYTSIKSLETFLAVQRLRLMLWLQGAQVWSLVGELRSHMPCNTAKKKKFLSLHTLSPKKTQGQRKTGSKEICILIILITEPRHCK